MAHMDYEAERLENLAQKEKLLAELRLDSNSVFGKPVRHDSQTKRSLKKRKISVEDTPQRTSARIASSIGPRPRYTDETQKYNFLEPTSKSKTGSKANPRRDRHRYRSDGESASTPLMPSQDAGEVSHSWSQWTPVGSVPTRDEDGTFHFTDQPTFTPNKSPEEVLREGAFGGSYFRPYHSKRLGILIQDDWRELPTPWTDGLDVKRHLTSPTYDADVNKFKVACGQSTEEWEAAGWIAFEFDIRGWFQWYCRFFMGRRCEDDERQVGRWRKCVGETGRWRRALLKKYRQMGVREVWDDGAEEDAREVSPVMHQTCHHWAWEVRQQVLDDFWSMIS